MINNYYLLFFLYYIVGPAHEEVVSSSNATFRYPSGIDILQVGQGKNEIAFVCDKGNSCIRFIKGVHSFNSNKLVGKLKLNQVLGNWKPEAVITLGENQLAVTEGTCVNMILMDKTYTSGQLVQIVANLQSPHGLCLSVRPHKILVADSHSVKEIDIDSKEVTVAAEGFNMAFDVAVSSSGVLAVSDLQDNCIHLLKHTEPSATFQKDIVIGNKKAGCYDGPTSEAQLAEPTVSAILCGDNYMQCVSDVCLCLVL